MGSRHQCRPRVELLESRDTPGVFTVSYSAANHTLFVAGDEAANYLVVSGTGDPTTFTLSSENRDTFVGPAGPCEGVWNINISTFGGNDSIYFNAETPIRIKGNLTVNGGDGENLVSLTDDSEMLAVAKNLTVINGNSGTGTTEVSFNSITVGGSVKVKNGDGNSTTTIFGNVGNNVAITGGTGADSTFVSGRIGGDVTIRHGRAAGASSSPGGDYIAYAFIGGNLSISFADGTQTEDIEGLEAVDVGNLTINTGVARIRTNVLNLDESPPVQVRGNVLLVGKGSQEILVGAPVDGGGLKVGGNFTAAGTIYSSWTFSDFRVGGAVTLLPVGGGDVIFAHAQVGKSLTVAGRKGDYSISAFDLSVGRATNFGYGSGTHWLILDDCTFTGTFTSTFAGGSSNIRIDTLNGTDGATVFQRGVRILQRSGSYDITLADFPWGTGDEGTSVVVMGRFIVAGAGGGTLRQNPNRVLFAFGNSYE